MCLVLPNFYYLSKNSATITIVSLRFILIFVLWRIGLPRESFCAEQVNWGFTNFVVRCSNRIIWMLSPSWSPWHARLGHPSFQTIRHLVHQFQLPCSSSKLSSNKCPSCCLGKLHRLSLPLTHHHSSRPLELVHSDVWGPAPIFSSSGHKYFVLFIDDYSPFTWLFPMKNKSKVFSIFKQFKSVGWKTIRLPN